MDELCLACEAHYMLSDDNTKCVKSTIENCLEYNDNNECLLCKNHFEVK